MRGLSNLPVYAATLALLCGQSWAQRWGPWHATGPFEHAAGHANLDKRHPPELTLSLMRQGRDGPDLSQVFRGEEDLNVGWREVARGSTALDVGQIEFKGLLGEIPGKPGWENLSAAYLYRTALLGSDRDVRIHLGSDDGVKVWLNGELLIQRAIGRGVNLYDEALVLPMKEGTNHLLVKVVNGEGGWGFRMGPWRKGKPAAVAAAIDRGVQYFLDRQLIDGSWGGHHGTTPGNTAFRLYTLLKCGLRPSHPAIQRGRAFLLAHENSAVYSCAAKILALAEMDHEGDKDRIRELVRVMEESVMPDGLFRYSMDGYNSHHERGDLSNALFAALALRSAAHVGVNVKPSLWSTVAKGALACQGPSDGKPRTGRAVEPRGFAYTPGGAPSSSMTVAGVSMLVIVSQEAGNRVLPRLKGPMVTGIRSGLGWLDENFQWHTNVGHGSGHHTFFSIYGMERVGGLLGTPVVARRDWYWEGADQLLKWQSPAGTWSEASGHVETELALLFLARATVSITGSAGRQTAPSWQTPDFPEAEVHLRATGDTPAVIWIESLSKQRVSAMEWVGQEGRGPHIRYVDYFAMRDFPGAKQERIARVMCDPEIPAGAQRHAIQHRFSANGDWLVYARVKCVLEPEGPGVLGQEVELASDAMLIEVKDVVSVDQLAYPTRVRKNMLRNASAVTLSSSHIHGEEHEKAVDGNYGTRWHSLVTDENPWVKIALRRSIRGRTIALAHGWPAPMYAGFPRPFRGELVINDQDSLPFRMDPDPMTKTLIKLPRTQRIRSIEIRITGALNGVLGNAALGFSEIEVYR
ncbi:MAG: hypothetical protein VYE81_05740 [Planctomycetota bacterium]|nr:hypothetical protein [Planctomycetota bacterium]